MIKDLILITEGDAENPVIWSQTPYKVLHGMLDAGIRVEKVNGYYLFGWLKQKIQNQLACRFDTLHTSNNYPSTKRMRAGRLAHDLAASDIRHCLFMGAPCLDGRQPDDKKYFAYIDALVRPWMGAMKRSWLSEKLFMRGLRKFEPEDIDSFRRLTKTFTFNEWTRQYLIQEYGLAEDKVVNVHFGVNLKLLEEEKNYGNDLLLIVLRPGTEYIKGLELLLPAFQLLRRTHPDVRLAVVGVEGRKQDGVTYYYKQPRETTVRLFKECTLYTMPAMVEPNGITYLEGLANKAPIVGLNRFAFPEFAGDGRFGFICQEPTPKALAATLADALSDKNRLRQMGEAGQRFVMENFTWEKTLQRMLEEMEYEN